MSILSWIIFGAIVGWLASLIMGTSFRQGVVRDIAVGILGALIGGFVMNFFGQPGVYDFNVYSILVAILGAIILIALVRLFRDNEAYMNP